ncbi:hypothetical protein Ac2012v2_002620 [Leucoagaricus gongylophorus]
MFLSFHSLVPSTPPRAFDTLCSDSVWLFSEVGSITCTHIDVHQSHDVEAGGVGKSALTGKSSACLLIDMHLSFSLQFASFVTNFLRIMIRL